MTCTEGGSGFAHLIEGIFNIREHPFASNTSMNNESLRLIRLNVLCESDEPSDHLHEAYTPSTAMSNDSSLQKTVSFLIFNSA